MQIFTAKLIIIHLSTGVLPYCTAFRTQSCYLSNMCHRISIIKMVIKMIDVTYIRHAKNLNVKNKKGFSCSQNKTWHYTLYDVMLLSLLLYFYWGYTIFIYFYRFCLFSGIKLINIKCNKNFCVNYSL